MALKKIIKDIDINASKEKIRHVLFDDAPYRIRAAEFMPGSYAETDWQKWSKARFLGPEGGGIFGTISENIPTEYMEITYEGMIWNNIEDTESPEAKAFQGAKEFYKLTEEGDHVHLHAEADMDENRFDDMNVARDRAIVKIKELAEAN